MQVFVNKLRPAYQLFPCGTSKREVGLDGVVIDKYDKWLPDAWVVSHSDGTIGAYYHDELEPEEMFYWYKVRKWYYGKGTI